MWKKRTVRPTRRSNIHTLDSRIKRHIVNLHFAKKSLFDIMQTIKTEYDVDTTAVDIQNFIKLYKMHGNLLLTQVKLKEDARFKQEHIDYLLNMARDRLNVGLSIEERAIRLNRAYPDARAKNLEVQDVLKKHGYARKVAKNEWNIADIISHKNARLKVVCQMIKYFLDGRELISIDETQVNR